MKDVCPSCWKCGEQMYLNGDMCVCSTCEISFKVENKIIRGWFG